MASTSHDEHVSLCTNSRRSDAPAQVRPPRLEVLRPRAQLQLALIEAELPLGDRLLPRLQPRSTLESMDSRPGCDCHRKTCCHTTLSLCTHTVTYWKTSKLSLPTLSLSLSLSLSLCFSLSLSLSPSLSISPFLSLYMSLPLSFALCRRHAQFRPLPRNMNVGRKSLC